MSLKADPEHAQDRLYERKNATPNRTWKPSQGINFASSMDHRISFASSSFGNSRSWFDSTSTADGDAGSKTSTNPSKTSSPSRSRPLSPQKVPLSLLQSTCEANQGNLGARTSSTAGSLDLNVSQKLAYPGLSASVPAFAVHTLYSLPTTATESSWEATTVSKEDEPGDLGEGNAREAAPVGEQPFRSPLGFHIPPDKLQFALDSAPESKHSYWQSSLYQGPEGDNRKVKVHYCKTRETTESVAQLFVDEEVIGFDIEWMAQAKATDPIKRNISLIQLASEERIALFHIAIYPRAKTIDDFVAPTLKKIMESPEITKVGVAIAGDATRLRKHLNIQCHGLFELSHLYKLVKSSQGGGKVDRRLVSLAQQVKEHLGLPLLKGDVQTSNWRCDLDHAQTQYAASDSYAGFQLYHQMEAKRKAFHPVPPRPKNLDPNQQVRTTVNPPKALIDEDPEEISESDMDSWSDLSDTDVSVEELSRDLFNVDITANSPQSPFIAPSPKIKGDPAAAPLSSKSTLASTVPHSDELDKANEWVASYVTTHSKDRKLRVNPACLRAYALWHQQGHDVPEVASFLRDPPLKDNTVMEYIFQAVQRENLEADTERIARMHEDGYQPYSKAHERLLESAVEYTARMRRFPESAPPGE